MSEKIGSGKRLRLVQEYWERLDKEIIDGMLYGNYPESKEANIILTPTPPEIIQQDIIDGLMLNPA